MYQILNNLVKAGHEDALPYVCKSSSLRSTVNRFKLILIILSHKNRVVYVLMFQYLQIPEVITGELNFLG